MIRKMNNRKIIVLLIVSLCFMCIGCKKDKSETKEEKENAAISLVNQAAKSLYFKNELYQNLNTDLELIDSFKNYPTVSIRWVSSSPDVISNSGELKRPNFYDKRCKQQGINRYMNVNLTAILMASYEYEGKTYYTDCLEKNFEFKIYTYSNVNLNGNILEIKQAAWNYIYEDNDVEKILTTNLDIKFSTTICGQVLVIPKSLDKGFFIHDGSDGIYINASNLGINCGDVLEISGDIMVVCGSLQMEVVNRVVPVKKKFEILNAEVITPSQYESKYCAYENIYSDEIIGFFGGTRFDIVGILEPSTTTLNKYYLRDSYSLGAKNYVWIYNNSYDEKMERLLKENLGKKVCISGVTFRRNVKINKCEFMWDGSISLVNDEENAYDKCLTILESINLKKSYKENFFLDDRGRWEKLSGEGINIINNTAYISRQKEDIECVLRVYVEVDDIILSKDFNITILHIDNTSSYITMDYEELYNSAKNSDDEKYYASGFIKEILDSQLGIFIMDVDGYDIIINGLYNYDGSIPYEFMNKNFLKVGDFVTIYGDFKIYNEKLETVNAWLIEFNGLKCS